MNIPASPLPLSTATPVREAVLTELTACQLKLATLDRLRERWEWGEKLTMKLAPYIDVDLSYTVQTCNDPDAHLISVPLNAHIDHYTRQIEGLMALLPQL